MAQKTFQLVFTGDTQQVLKALDVVKNHALDNQKTIQGAIDKTILSTSGKQTTASLQITIDQAKKYLAVVKELEAKLAGQQLAGGAKFRELNNYAEEKNKLSQFISERQAMLRADANVQKQIAIHGIDSIQAYRAKAAQEALRLEQIRQAEIARVSANVKAGGLLSVGQAQIDSANAKYLRDLQAVNAELARHESRLKTAHYETKNLIIRVAELVGTYRLLMTAWQLVKSAALSVPHTGIHYEGTMAGLQAITKSSAGASREMAFLNSEAERTGITLDSLRSSFRLFSASALASGESMATVEKIFKNVNTMATTLHMSADDVNGVFLALGQTFNKGKLQAEELVKQLAQRVPGSVTVMAKAYAKEGESIQKATQRLLKDMKAGQVSAHTNLENFSKVLAETYGGEAFAHASKGLNSELGRLSTAWTHLTENIYKGSSSSITSVVRFGTAFTESLEKATSNTFELEQSFNHAGRVVEFVFKGMGTAITAFTVGSLAVLAARVPVTVATVTAGLTSLSASWTAFNAVVLTHPVALVATLVASLATLGAQYQSIIDKRRALEEAAFAPEEKPKTKAEEFSYAIDQDEKVRRLKEQLEAAGKDVEKYTVSFFGIPVKHEALNRAVAVQDALFKKYVLARREAASALRAQEELGGVNDSTLTVDIAKEAATEQNRLLEERKAKLQEETALRTGAIEVLKQELALELEKNKASTQATALKERIAKLEADNLAKQKAGQQELVKLTEKKVALDKEVSYSKMVKSEQRVWEVMRSLEPARGDIYRPSATGAMGQFQMQPGTYEQYKEPDAPSARGFFAAEARARTLRKSLNTYDYRKTLDTATITSMREFGEVNDKHMRQASLNYMKHLLEVFKDYPAQAVMALAAYNAGEGGVKSAIAKAKKSGGSWEQYLPRETRGYIEKGKPRLFANEGDYNEMVRANSSREVAAAQLEVIKTTNSQRVLEIEKQKEALALDRQRLELEEKRATQIADITAKIEEGTASNLAAELAKNDKIIQKYREEFTKSDNYIGFMMLPALKESLDLRSKLAETERNSQLAGEQFALKEQEIQMKKRLFLTSERDAITETQQERFKYLTILETELRLLEDIASKSDHPADKIKAARKQQEIDALKYPMTGALEKLNKDDMVGTRAYQTDMSNLESDKTSALAKLNDLWMAEREGYKNHKELLAQIDADYAEKKREIEETYSSASAQTQLGYMQGIATVGANVADGLTQNMIKMYGAQSKEARRAFAFYKALKIAEVGISTAKAVMAQLENPTPYVGIALAAVAAAMGAAQIAQIVATPMPSAHSGLTNVPETGTYVLKNGERVVAPEQNKDLTQFLREAPRQQQQTAAVTPNVSVTPKTKVVNVWDSQVFSDYLNSAEGEELIVNHMKRNREVFA